MRSTPRGRRPAARRRRASPGGPAELAHLTPARRAASLRGRLRGPWRVAVTESSRQPAIEPGDWLLVDPTVTRWPRRGSVVVFREPDSDDLALKRAPPRPADPSPH